MGTPEANGPPSIDEVESAVFWLDLKASENPYIAAGETVDRTAIVLRYVREVERQRREFRDATIAFRATICAGKSEYIAARDRMAAAAAPFGLTFDGQAVPEWSE